MRDVEDLPSMWPSGYPRIWKTFRRDFRKDNKKKYLVYKHDGWQQWMTLEEVSAFALRCIERHIELGGKEKPWLPTTIPSEAKALALRGYILLEVIPPSM